MQAAETILGPVQQVTSPSTIVISPIDTPAGQQQLQEQLANQQLDLPPGQPSANSGGSSSSGQVDQEGPQQPGQSSAASAGSGGSGNSAGAVNQEGSQQPGQSSASSGGSGNNAGPADQEGPQSGATAEGDQQLAEEGSNAQGGKSSDKKSKGDDSGVDPSLGLLNAGPVQMKGDVEQPVTSGGMNTTVDIPEPTN